MERKDKITELVKSLLPAHQRGKNLVVDTCPFCGEKNVMAFSPDKEVAKCFRCGMSVTILGLVMAQECREGAQKLELVSLCYQGVEK